VSAPTGRGERTVLDCGGAFTLIDESYNANPASMRAALATLGEFEVGRGRRSAVLGDMKELGDTGPALHRDLAKAVETSRIDAVFAAGPLMQNLVEVLPPDRRGGYAATAAELEDTVLGAVRAGDVVMVKGSKGILVSRIVKALKDRYPPAPERQAAKG